MLGNSVSYIFREGGRNFTLCEQAHWVLLRILKICANKNVCPLCVAYLTIGRLGTYSDFDDKCFSLSYLQEHAYAT